MKPCPICRSPDSWKADTLMMTAVRAVFECGSCGIVILTKPQEMEAWMKLKGRKEPPPAQSTAITMDHELVARSTNIVNQ